MQAIRTRYHGASNTRGSYISAKCAMGSIRFGYRSELSSTGNHEAAAQALREKMGWGEDYGTMVSGEFADCIYHVFTKV